MGEWVGGHLGCGAEPNFYYNSVELVFLVLCFKFHRNWTINGQVIQDSREIQDGSGMAAILDLNKCVRFCLKSLKRSAMYLCIQISSLLASI